MKDPVVVRLAHRIAAKGALLGCDLHAGGHRVPVEAVVFGPHSSGQWWVVTYVCPVGPVTGRGDGHVNQRQLPDGRLAHTLLLAGAWLLYVPRIAEFADADRAAIAARGPIGRGEVLEAAVLAGSSPWQQDLAEQELTRWLAPR